MAVDHAHRSRSLGQQLVKAQRREAQQLGIQDVCLLTETAHDDFLRRGFRALERSAIAPAIQCLVEWTIACR